MYCNEKNTRGVSAHARNSNLTTMDRWVHCERKQRPLANWSERSQCSTGWIWLRVDPVWLCKSMVKVCKVFCCSVNGGLVFCFCKVPQREVMKKTALEQAKNNSQSGAWQNNQRCWRSHSDAHVCTHTNTKNHLAINTLVLIRPWAHIRKRQIVS